jgi:hypothetical protein
VCAYVRVCMHAFVCTCTRLSCCVCACVRARLCRCAIILCTLSVCVCMCICRCVCLRVCFCMLVCARRHIHKQCGGGGVGGMGGICMHMHGRTRAAILLLIHDARVLRCAASLTHALPPFLTQHTQNTHAHTHTGDNSRPTQPLNDRTIRYVP